jgi:hypothetical protein
LQKLAKARGLASSRLAKVNKNSGLSVWEQTKKLSGLQFADKEKISGCPSRHINILFLIKIFI